MGRGTCGSATKVDKFTLLVERQGGVVGKPRLDVFDLEVLLQILAERHGLVPRLFDAFERLVELDDLLHFGLDGREIILGQAVRQVKIVVEATFDCWSERQLHAVEQPHHGPSHDVGAGMPHHIQGFLVLFREQLQFDLAFLGQREVQAHGFAVDFGADGGLGESGTDIEGHIAGGGRPGKGLFGAVWQNDFQHVGSCGVGGERRRGRERKV